MQGAAWTLTVQVAVFVPAVAVMIASPGATAVTLPVAESTVATSGLLVDQATVSVESDGVTVAVRLVSLFTGSQRQFALIKSNAGCRLRRGSDGDGCGDTCGIILVVHNSHRLHTRRLAPCVTWQFLRRCALRHRCTVKVANESFRRCRYRHSCAKTVQNHHSVTGVRATPCQSLCPVQFLPPAPSVTAATVSNNPAHPESPAFNSNVFAVFLPGR